MTPENRLEVQLCFVEAPTDVNENVLTQADAPSKLICYCVVKKNDIFDMILMFLLHFHDTNEAMLHIPCVIQDI